MENKADLTHLRAAFASALKYHPAFGMLSSDAENAKEYHNLWRVVLEGGKIPDDLDGINGISGDVFAFWYMELGLDPMGYQIVASQFFERNFNTPS